MCDVYRMEYCCGITGVNHFLLPVGMTDEFANDPIRAFNVEGFFNKE
jgi:hypothetical protein